MEQKKDTPANQKTNLLPCPFCGNEHVRVVEQLKMGHVEGYVICNKCGARGPRHVGQYSLLKAANNWNLRKGGAQ